MANFNKVILAGALTRDPELRYLPNGTAIANLGLAINESYADKEGNKRESAVFVDITAFGKQAETIGKYFKKGRPILIEGRLKLDQWDDKTTHQKRSKLAVILETFSFLDYADKNGAPATGSAPAPSPAPANQAPSTSAPPPPPGEDDVPF